MPILEEVAGGEKPSVSLMGLPTAHRTLLRLIRVCIIGLLVFGFGPAAAYGWLTWLLDEGQWRLTLLVYVVEVPAIGGLSLMVIPWLWYRHIHNQFKRWESGEMPTRASIALVYEQALELPVKVALIALMGAAVGYTLGALIVYQMAKQPLIEAAKVLPAIVLVGGLSGAFCYFGVGGALRPIVIWCSRNLRHVRPVRQVSLAAKFLSTTYIIVMATLCLLHPATYTLGQVITEDLLQHLALSQLRLTSQRVVPSLLPWSESLAARNASLRTVLRAAHVGEHGYVFAADEAGRIVTPHPLGYSNVEQESFRKSLAAAPETEGNWVERRGEHRTVSFLKLATPPWTLVSVAYPSDFSAPLRHFVQFSFIPIAVVAAMVMLFGSYFTRGITLPLAELRTAAQRIAEEGDLTSYVPITTNDELADVAGAFNHMVDELSASQNRLTENAARLERSAQQLAELNQEMEDLLRVVSHDLRAPLINIQGFSNRLRRNMEEVLERLRKASDRSSDPHLKAEIAAVQQTTLPKLDESLRFISKGVEKMDGLLCELLAISRIGRKADPKQPNDLNAIVDDVLATFDHQLKEKSIQVIRHSMPAGVPCRRNEINQVFSNLVSNAINYMGDAPGPTIEISAERMGDHIQCSVKDSGIGIATQDHERIFHAFTRLETLAVPGEGVGLAYVKKVVRLHGGRIWVESAVGNGSNFLFTLPLKEEDAA